MISAVFLLWTSLLLYVIQATSLLPPPSLTNLVPATPTTNTSHPTIPIYCLYVQQYYVEVGNSQGQLALARVDYLLLDLWVLDGQGMLECDVLYTVLKDVTDTVWEATKVTYDHLTYRGLECYWLSAFYPTQTITTIMGSVKTTMVQVQQTGDPFQLEYANGVLVEGVTATANITMNLQDSNKLELPSFLYLLATEANRNIGAMGLAHFPGSEGVLDRLVQQNLTHANSYSIFYFNETDEESYLAGFLFPGSVDKSLFIGDFYSFPMVSYVGQGSVRGSLPIISLDNMELENLLTENKAAVYEESLPIAIDPLLDFTYLPLSAIVNIALQTNAFYSSSQGVWVVKCSDIDNSNATLNLNMGPLALKIPLTALLNPRSDSSALTFAGGEAACIFNLFPSDSLGYPCIGSPMLRFMYMAVDNEGRNVALANSNQDLKPNDDNRNLSLMHISSGLIPFATTHNVTTLTETFTFYQQNSTSDGSIPARLSQVQINSDGVYITDGISNTQTNSASAAQAASSTGGADRGVPSMDTNASYIKFGIILLGSVMGMSLL